MADFTALKNTIETYIKQNGNEEITGNILQGVLLAMVETLGDSAINDLITALSNEVTARENADGTLQTNITNEATARGNADTALGHRIDGEITNRENADTALGQRIDGEITNRQNADTALQNAINAINTKLAEGYVYAGIATPSTNPSTPTGKVFYFATGAGTYANFIDGSSQALVLSSGINILKFNGTAWSQEQVIAIDAVPTAGSANLVKSGGVYSNTVKSANSVNLFNKNSPDIVPNKYIAYNNGGVEDAPGYQYIYISVAENTEYTLSGVTNCHVAFFGAQWYLSGLLNPSTFTTPEGCVRLSLSFPMTENDTAMLVLGSVASKEYVPYKILDINEIGYNTIPIGKIKDAAQNGRNIFSLDSLVRGGYIDYSNGGYVSLASYEYVTIPCKADEIYTLSGLSNVHLAFFYGSTYISGLLNPQTFTVPSGADRMTISFPIVLESKAQLEYGSYKTPYTPHRDVVLNPELFDNASIPSKKILHGKNIILVWNGTGGYTCPYKVDYTSLTQALYENEENCIFFVFAGTYDLEVEFKALFGNDYFSNFNYETSPFHDGLYLKHGCEMHGVGEVKILLPAMENMSETFEDKFSPLCTSVNNVVDNINIISNGNGKYLLHDDFAGDITGNYQGKNVFKNITFTGTSSKDTQVGGGMGMFCSYIYENCIFSGATYNISYHNGYNPGKNKVIISNCLGDGVITATHYGYSTEKSPFYINNSKFEGYRYTDASSGAMVHDNVVVIEWNNEWTNMQ